MKRVRSAALAAPLLVLSAAACGPGTVESPKREFASDVEECAGRLREIHRAMVDLKRERGWQPTAPRAIPGDLLATGFWPESARARLECPGGPYASRDLAAFPLERFPTNGKEVLMACANAAAPNHAGGEVNVLYADGSVRTLSLAQEIAAERLPAGTARIPVGPGSPLADLAKLAP
jgi:prepilin-type processing-associated H-X9-DG protein